ncbi:hypothetical protein E1263_03880 [Kribbella antibiotica]|uniref:Uncharacterized protein n=1 Tax=Kribbella antibiotica TaxID=190195 RepID=A0A4V6PEA3_9ACTN|nr:hypothetical protein [Kribbella antibiotica]TDD62307.1 hypothetical protein E1263_03880 [Kribbella antibiotica]
MADKDDELVEDREAAELNEEELERAAGEERELEEIRNRRETLDATAETAEAIRLAEANEAAGARHRELADGERRQARSDHAHGNHLLDESAARPDEPGADATAAAGRRYQRAGDREDRAASYDDRVADRYADASRDQAPASDAARRPAQPPEARKFVQPRKAKKREKNTGLDLDL